MYVFGLVRGNALSSCFVSASSLTSVMYENCDCPQRRMFTVWLRRNDLFVEGTVDCPGVTTVLATLIHFMDKGSDDLESLA